jgi:hypothetical protein
MSQQDKLSGEPSARFDPQFLMAAPIGLSTPLFLAFYSAASVGAAFWWMSQLTRYTHLEAKMAETPAAPEPTAPEPVVILACEPEVEPVSDTVEAQEVAAAEPEAIEAPVQPKPAAKPRARKTKATA